jgi:hypothetical protein
LQIDKVISKEVGSWMIGDSIGIARSGITPNINHKKSGSKKNFEKIEEGRKC